MSLLAYLRFSPVSGSLAAGLDPEQRKYQLFDACACVAIHEFDTKQTLRYLSSLLKCVLSRDHLLTGVSDLAAPLPPYSGFSLEVGHRELDMI